MFVYTLPKGEEYRECLLCGKENPFDVCINCYYKLIDEKKQIFTDLNPLVKILNIAVLILYLVICITV